MSGPITELKRQLIYICIQILDLRVYVKFKLKKWTGLQTQYPLKYCRKLKPPVVRS